jgi:hypothetical protein
MSRYIQEAVKPEEESKEEVREMPKATKTPTWSRGSVNG